MQEVSGSTPLSSTKTAASLKGAAVSMSGPSRRHVAACLAANNARRLEPVASSLHLENTLRGRAPIQGHGRANEVAFAKDFAMTRTILFDSPFLLGFEHTRDLIERA